MTKQVNLALALGGTLALVVVVVAGLAGSANEKTRKPTIKTGASYFRFIDVATGKATPAFAKGQHLGCAFVGGDTAYAFGVDRWGGSKITGPAGACTTRPFARPMAATSIVRKTR